MPFIICLAVYLDDTWCRSNHTVLQREFDAWCVEQADDGMYDIVREEHVIRFDSLQKALDYISIDPGCGNAILPNSDLLLEAVAHPELEVIHCIRLFELPAQQEGPCVAQLLIEAGFHVAAIDEPMNYGNQNGIELFWERGEQQEGVDVIRFNEPLVENAEEMQYHHILKKILATGIYTPPANERTGTGTISVFGEKMRFSLRNHRFPLLTTKKVYYKGIVAELMMMLRGHTDTTKLEEQNVNIWKGNTSREFLNSRGLSHLPVGDMGELYGFVWRHWGAKYTDCKADYTGQGIDQLANIVNEIKTTPTSRRMVLSAWNVATLDGGCLPPCHFTATFSVRRGELHCCVSLRSNDAFLGTCFNIGQYALLTIILAHLTSLAPGELVYVSHDTHVYLNHIDAALTQLARLPTHFPKLHITTPRNDLDSWQADDFTLTEYAPQAAIKAEMSV